MGDGDVNTSNNDAGGSASYKDSAYLTFLNFAAAILVIVLILFVIFFAIRWNIQRSPDTIVHQLKVDIHQGKAYSDSAAKSLVSKYDSLFFFARMLEKNNAEVLDEVEKLKSAREEEKIYGKLFLSFLAIVLALVGFFGFKTFADIRHRSRDVATDTAKKVANEEARQTAKITAESKLEEIMDAARKSARNSARNKAAKVAREVANETAKSKAEEIANRELMRIAKTAIEDLNDGLEERIVELEKRLDVNRFPEEEKVFLLGTGGESEDPFDNDDEE